MPVPTSVLLARLALVLQTVALRLDAGQMEQAIIELEQARGLLADIQKETP